MIKFIANYWVLILAFFGIVWFVLTYIISDLPDDILSQAYKRIKAKGKEGADGRVRDNR